MIIGCAAARLCYASAGVAEVYAACHVWVMLIVLVYDIVGGYGVWCGNRLLAKTSCNIGQAHKYVLQGEGWLQDASTYAHGISTLYTMCTCWSMHGMYLQEVIN